ncbi:bifunctional tRNA (5-methylaminomethyl-2-thiouridine)(34)-methyltransferase MnmD/FAD-dependent 5-carboxymethylaminomethyl-2-thiouridine(34) oxidoreductase MnmC [Ketobacter alkanivorans]|uniref:tRNA 5-methylaminomethyl-2-thiouridine biosynthesis bifunctional protein MnmC n=1 Tax=Ketobacter alkanivorans TaxID=1917421 RepID=A0A2K9LQ06_9GAMM|nr:bifunctional tRNA (5-methylaminomethyl-2-thiouridine)(34)-methyltransferase MnmD/FAD-dependent 5-carboxymethylaminomethyl-2-thiouridine(34) oxidoreductase MnmC [Ketobacter alkanivorans]AUM14408.1 bifunctional tRNA (5-methylaminomethyl-2-thiouridine)(34)-methyltransferase MnmD/FAD-dependent 5-carboxymethylaminomethyl-2-thiouridine(34) oxidoreductase MnmC [Ketobacter alkanivorans]
MKQPSTYSQIIQPAKIEWQNSTPVSEQFGDVYFSRDSGAAESRYVFLDNNHLAQRWHSQQLTSFTIAETGFGTGLNFMCAADLWRTTKLSGALSPNAHLHFVSVEKYPLSKSDLQHACQLHPQYNWLSTCLLQQYPAPVAGSHRLYFPECNITLTLIYGEAINSFQQLEGLVDAWFLDGFAPAKNPDMWQPELFKHIGRLSHEHATAATFTAAGVVKRGLQSVGFKMEKVPGFGSKRDMLRGTIATPEPAAQNLSHAEKPWFHYAYREQCKIPSKVAIIGAGLAGATAANSLARRGWQVSVFEKEAQIASHGSGNPSGITFTKLSLHDTPQNRYYQSAYLYACRYLSNTLRRLNIKEGKDWRFNGVLRLAYNEKEAADQAALLDAQYWPTELMQPLTPEQIHQITGLVTDLGGVMLHGGGWLNPAALCHTLLQQPDISLHTGHAINQLHLEDRRWFLDDHGPFDAVVLASAFDCSHYSQTGHLPLKPVRGQISFVPQTEESSNLRHAINYNGYINPAREGFHCLGATFTPKLGTPEQRQEDHQWNCDQLISTLPNLADQLCLPDAHPLQGRVGFRCQTPDYLPVVGPLPNQEYFQDQYKDLSKGFLKRTFPVGQTLPGLFVSSGHGSRGITSTCFGAEIIASYLSGEPQIADKDVLFAIHPARFLIRNIIRRSR